ncbi:MAG: DUF188 domain-containing protein [Bullifex sp.]
MEFRLYLDADSLPVRHREIIIRRCVRENIEAYFVADRELPDVREAIRMHTIALRTPYRTALDAVEIRKIRSTISMIVVKGGENAADDRITEIASPPALCITHDIPLAERLIKKGITVIDDRGNLLDESNIRQRMSVRKTQKELREMGIFNDRQKHFDERTIMEFANAFDRALGMLKAGRNQK